ncbi:hypothetical protein BDC45DRAFT_539568 [Circinella umbellata]|nr:hypothetical protein BDC45DRAFT_539568 [Circinella umbellata]
MSGFNLSIKQAAFKNIDAQKDPIFVLFCTTYFDNSITGERKLFIPKWSHNFSLRERWSDLFYKCGMKFTCFTQMIKKIRTMDLFLQLHPLPVAFMFDENSSNRPNVSSNQEDENSSEFSIFRQWIVQEQKGPERHWPSMDFPTRALLDNIMDDSNSVDSMLIKIQEDSLFRGKERSSFSLSWRLKSFGTEKEKETESWGGDRRFCDLVGITMNIFLWSCPSK